MLKGQELPSIQTTHEVTLMFQFVPMDFDQFCITHAYRLSKNSN